MKEFCNGCLNKGKLCKKCIYHKNLYDYSQYYYPTCPYGEEDCVYDPAYIKYNYPEWYKKLYGEKTPEEASITCGANAEFFDGTPSCYDNEDK